MTGRSSNSREFLLLGTGSNHTWQCWPNGSQAAFPTGKQWEKQCWCMVKWIEGQRLQQGFGSHQP